MKRTERINGTIISELPLCGIFAIAFVADKSVTTVFKQFRKIYKKPPQWRGRTSRSKCVAMLKHYGLTWEEMPETGVYGHRNSALYRWVDWYCTKGRTYFVETTGHWQVVRDGIVHDQCGSRPIAEFTGKGRRVRCAFVMA